MKILLICFIAIFTNLSFAHEAGETVAKIGKGQAVEAFDEHEGLKLSNKTIAALGIEFSDIIFSTTYQIPPGALLQTKEEYGVYILRENWFKYLIASSVKKTPNGFQAKISELRAGDKIVTQGLALLRVAHLNLLGETEGAHRD